MIEPNSLMKFNLVLFEGRELVVTEILTGSCEIATNNSGSIGFKVRYDELDPIKLTPSILERCGFVKKILSDTNPDEGHYYSLNLSNDKNCDLAILSGDKTEEFDCYLFPYDMIRIKNLHTLMNLTKTLTGKELEIKK
jgi:hypothetical protein